jgi:hypothetical protein
MPLMIQTIRGGLARLVVVCDHCGREIAEAREGILRWKLSPAAVGPPKLAYFTHRTCGVPFERDHPEPPWGTAELDSLPALLAENFGMGQAIPAGLLSPLA